jgi:hypothetical protein
MLIELHVDHENEDGNADDDEDEPVLAVAAALPVMAAHDGVRARPIIDRALSMIIDRALSR